MESVGGAKEAVLWNRWAGLNRQRCRMWNTVSDMSKMNTGSCVKALKCDTSTKSEVSISNIHQMAFGFLQSQFMRIEERSGFGVQNKSA